MLGADLDEMLKITYLDVDDEVGLDRVCVRARQPHQRDVGSRQQLGALWKDLNLQEPVHR